MRGTRRTGALPPGAVKYRDGMRAASWLSLVTCLSVQPGLPTWPCSKPLRAALFWTRQPHGLPSHPSGHAGRDASRQEDLETQGPRIRETHTDPNMERWTEDDRDTDIVPRPRGGPGCEIKVGGGCPDLQQGLVGKATKPWREDAAPASSVHIHPVIRPRVSPTASALPRVKKLGSAGQPLLHWASVRITCPQPARCSGRLCSA